MDFLLFNIQIPFLQFISCFRQLNTSAQHVFLLKSSKPKAGGGQFFENTKATRIYLTSSMLASQHFNQTYFLGVISLNPSLTPCLQLYNLQICLLYRSFCSLACKCNTRTFLHSCQLMVFKLKRSRINISCCRLARKNISYTLRFALRSLTTSVAPYLTGFNIKIDCTYILCCILSWKYFTGTFLLTF